MRWITTLSIAALLGGALALPLAADGAPTARQVLPADPMAVPTGCGTAHALGLQASFGGEFPGGPPRGPHGAPGLETPVPPYLHALTLSDEQQDSIFDLLHAQAPQARQLARTVHRSRTRLHALALSDHYDEAAAHALIDTASRADAELALLRTRTDHQILALLTPAQRKQLAAEATDPQPHDCAGPGHGPVGWH